MTVGADVMSFEEIKQSGSVSFRHGGHRRPAPFFGRERHPSA